MEHDTLYRKIAQHVTGLFRQYEQPFFRYHTLRHTETVAEHAMMLADHYHISEREKLVVYAAAWFHDTGHLTGDIEGHEERSVQLMRSFLEGEKMENAFIDDVAKVILATRFPPQPANLLEKILCDADTWHFGTPDFNVTNKQVKKELKLRGHATKTKGWREKTVQLLEDHRFHTDYAREHLSSGKEENVAVWKHKLEKKQDDDDETDEPAETLVPLPESSEDSKAAKKKKKDGLVTRGIQTMLRLTSENHLRLSEMADGKANILISVNSIIIGVILSVLLRRLEIDTYLTIPTMIFLASSVATIIIAILATLPKVTQGRFNKEDIANRKVNLLFFGNFYRSSLPEYEWAMERLMEDKEYLYGSLVKDIYQLGVVLGKKYRLVRLAYYVFMIGIIASVIAFTVAVLLNGPHPTPVVTDGTRSPI